MSDVASAHLAAAETALIRGLSLVPNHAMAHMFLGAVQMQTLRAAKGIAECEQALALDRNLADAHGFIGLGKYVTGRGEEVEAHIQEALDCPFIAFRSVCRQEQLQLARTLRPSHVSQSFQLIEITHSPFTVAAHW